MALHLQSTDVEMWEKYPRHHFLFNKLWIAEHQLFKCGPAEVPVPETAEYVVRPIYNLRGMGWGTRFKNIQKGETGRIPPGYFWCERFEGQHYSVDFANKKPILTVLGEYTSPGHFIRWTKVEHQHFFPSFLNHIEDVPVFNAEYIGKNLIEVHLRANPDFEGHDYKELTVAWERDFATSFQMGRTHIFIPGEEGTEFDTRLGFWAR